MIKKIHYLQVLLLLFYSQLIAQKNLNYSGIVFDKDNKQPLELATVYLENAKDSTIIEMGTTDKKGLFYLHTKKYDKPIFLKINFEGYKTFKLGLKNLSESKNFGTIYLSKEINTLKEVVIKSEAPPVRVKKDTLEFNAASFKTRPDANVETLLRQLPGFEVDSDGKITVNGKEVNQFLVNGKTFLTEMVRWH